MLAEREQIKAIGTGIHAVHDKELQPFTVARVSFSKGGENV